jgi:hypothetical protein
MMMVKMMTMIMSILIVIMSKYFMVYRQDCSDCKRRKFFEDALNLVQNVNRNLFEQNTRYMK